MNAHPLKNPRWWLFLILFTKIPYIPLEFAFNGELINTVGAGASLEDIHGVELFGRTISAIAIGILACRLAGWYQGAHVRNWCWVLGSFCLLSPLMFFGQKAAVTAISQSFGPESRRIATLVSFLPSALNNGAKVEGFEFANLKTPEAKTFLSTVGALLFFSESAHLSILNNAERLAREETMRRTFAGGPDVVWKDYIEAGEPVRKAYAEYRRASDGLESTMRDTDSIAEARWKEVSLEIAAGWNEVKPAFDRAVSEEEVTKLYDNLREYFRMRSHREAQERYAARMREIFGRLIDDSEWCDGDTCPGYPDFLARHVRTLLVKESIVKSGLNPDESLAENLRAVRFGRHISARFSKKGISLPNDWTPSDSATFIDTLSRDIKKNAPENFAKQISTRLGDQIPPRLSFEEFESQPIIQKRIREELGKKLHVLPNGPLSVQWDRKTFENTAVIPALDRGAKRLIRERICDVHEYADHQRCAQEGRDAIKLILIPVISLTLSVFFGLLNIISILATGAEIIKKDLEYLFNWKFWSLMIIILLAVFLVIPTGLSNQSGYGNVMDKAPWWASVVSWLVRAEPSIYGFSDWARTVVVKQYLGRDSLSIKQNTYDWLMGLDDYVLPVLFHVPSDH